MQKGTSGLSMGSRIIFKNFRIVDETTDMNGTVVTENGFISGVIPGDSLPREDNGAAMIIDGSRLAPSNALPVLMPAFVDLHAHFRDLGSSHDSGASPPSDVLLPAEMLESASLAAIAGGFATVVCMANTKPAIDSPEKARNLKKRSDVLGLIDLYPVMTLTKGLEGKELSEINALAPLTGNGGGNDSNYVPPMLSEDGKDIADDDLFLAAMKEAKRLGIPISCHCDLGGESNAVRRVIELGKQAGCHIHIAHVSTKEAVAAIAQAKREIATETGGFTLTCEAMPHNLCLTEEDARKLGETSWGRVSPPLRSEEDRKTLIQAVVDGTIDAIATDHAPHTGAAKEAGTPGFSGLETAFAAVFTELVRGEIPVLPGLGGGSRKVIDLRRLSSLMSAHPARLIGLGYGPQKRGRILNGYRADLVIIDTRASWIVDPENLMTRGKNSPFTGQELYGKILMTIRGGRVVFER